MARLRRIGKALFGLLAAAWLFSILQVLALRWIDPVFTLTMVQRKFEYSAQDRPTNITYKPVQLPPKHPLKRAFTASEDSWFYLHSGFDWLSICDAASANRTSKRRRGGSTISQQVSKNVFLWQHPSWVRKGLEAYYTILLELFVSKERILDIYLNIAETGVGTFGVQAAAERYFQQDAADLTLQQAGQIAGLLPSPQTRAINGSAARERAQFVRRFPAPMPSDKNFETFEPRPWLPTCLWQ